MALTTDAIPATDGISEQGIDTSVLSSLAGHIRTKWEQAKKHKFPVEQEMLKSKRARKGEYEPEKLAAMRAMYTAAYNPGFMPITETKCMATEALIKDIIIQPDTPPYDLKPTPIPEIPPSITQNIKESIYQGVLNAAMQEAAAMGQPLDFQAIKMRAEAYLPDIKERIDREIKKHARKAAEKMKLKISDQFAEGGWDREFNKTIYDVVTYKAGFLKGPSQRKETVITRTLNESGMWETKTEERITSKYERRSPFNIYPMPGVTDIDDGGLFDKISLSAKQLSNLIGVPYYKEEAIREVLRQYRVGGLNEWTTIESDKNILGNKGSTVEDIDCLEFWGTIQGQMLLDWGIGEDEAPDPEKEYDVCVWLIGTQIIKAMINPDSLGKKPFSKASLVEDPDSFWGKGIPELIAAIQEICNTVGRYIVLNVAYGALPQTEVDIDRVDAVGNPYPGKLWRSTNSQMRTGKAINFYQPSMVTDQLIQVYEWGMKQADEHSGIPRFAMGSPQVGGVRTSTGQSMMLNQSTKVLKAFVKNLDGLIVGSVERQYYFNLEYEDDIGLIGDTKVVAKGSSSLMAKEQQAIRLGEFLDRTNNPVDMGIIGMEGRRGLLRESAKPLGIDVDKVVSADEELDGYMQAIQGQQGRPGSQLLGPDGAPIVGQDNNLFKGQKE